MMPRILYIVCVCVCDYPVILTSVIFLVVVSYFLCWAYYVDGLYKKINITIDFIQKMKKNCVVSK